MFFHGLFRLPLWRHLYSHLRYVTRMQRLDLWSELREVAEFQVQDMIVQAVEMWAITPGV